MRPDLAAIEKRATAATEGPWLVAGGYVASRGQNKHVVVEAKPRATKEGGYAVASCGPFDDPGSFPDATFIANARADVPALIARCRELEAGIRGLVAMHRGGPNAVGNWDIAVAEAEALVTREISA